ncbi:MAG: hypothetical protein PHW72_02745 [Candidatus Pacebacteria bacterium]|nr:hypothetical protein [Candidatus Paceibacterota bacterium]
MKNQNKPCSNNNIFSKDALRSVFLAILAVALISGALSWQYNKIAKSEKKLSSLEDLIERSLAQDALDKFMVARNSGEEDQVTAFLTEKAFEQRNESPLSEGFKNYSVIKGQKTESRVADDGHAYEFTIEITEKNGMGETLERIILLKILDKYYIDSVEIAG